MEDPERDPFVASWIEMIDPLWPPTSGSEADLWLATPLLLSVFVCFPCLVSLPLLQMWNVAALPC